jgi:hypothetical protein
MTLPPGVPRAREHPPRYRSKVWVVDCDPIVLTIDRATAQALWQLLYDVGEHWAAGADLVASPHSEMEQLGGLLRAVDTALGRNTKRFA